LKANFNVYHFFAGAFVPFRLLSRQEVGPGAKLTYAAMAQQANSRSAVQLHFRVQAPALGEDEGQLSRHLMELEEVGLIQVSRGNVFCPWQLLATDTLTSCSEFFSPLCSRSSWGGHFNARRMSGFRGGRRYSFDGALRAKPIAALARPSSELAELNSSVSRPTAKVPPARLAPAVAAGRTPSRPSRRRT
jgi:hypothetical protein